MSWEAVIGLEIHVQLKTRTKMFCRCAVGALDDPNTRTCPVCLALPGSLPVPNRQAVEWTIRLGLALGCEIAGHAVFHRKHYFYPDNPKGYQISQYDEPLCVNGRVRLPGPDGVAEIGITRAHLEEDAAKTLHVGGAEGRIHGATASLVDFNRGGTPLVEIVTEPDIRTAEQARRFLQLLRQTVVELGISDAEMEKGSLRFDVNVSVRPTGSDELRTRTELKNMNSFAFAARGIEHEIERQIATYESGGQVEQETLHFDPNREDAPPLRSKEEAEDYRYFPEPDLVPIEPLREWSLDELGGKLPESPSARLERVLAAGLELRDAEALNAEPARVSLFETIGEAGVEPRAAAAFVLNDVAPRVDPARVDGAELAKVLRERDQIPREALDAAVAASASKGFTADEYLRERTVADASELDPVIDRILSENGQQVEAYRGGKEGLLGFFVGQVMRETQGKANPKVVNERLREKLKT
ncbi:MAG: Asp-tRNA(Asn)/Glu-tRNA(Gln) amidotransferase subunit GatB [Actinobacteria bacterium]|nr:MAG: Asp-tRNA(Asn)/Glu-tRNA(Gln) amidotransferase subunit GatB [Actinomycetota bacterium]